MVEYDWVNQHNDDDKKDESFHPKSFDSSAVGAVMAEFALVRQSLWYAMQIISSGKLSKAFSKRVKINFTKLLQLCSCKHDGNMSGKTSL